MGHQYAEELEKDLITYSLTVSSLCDPQITLQTPIYHLRPDRSAFLWTWKRWKVDSIPDGKADDFTRISANASGQKHILISTESA